jgi:hypothetical protein
VGVAGEPAETLTLRDRPSVAAGSADVLTLFAVLWAAAALFHVLGPSGRAFGLVDDVTKVGASQLAVAVVALALLARPRTTWLLVLLAIVGPVSAWYEAPVLGNHWLVASFVDLAIIGAAIASRSRRIDRARLAAVAMPIARWTLIVFYSFAAFAKLNNAFFDTNVGCGTFYFDELAGSLGFSTPIAVGHGGWAHLVPFGVAGTELAIPVLLLGRRTRNAGVALGLVFHSFIALDQTHLFSDFSSVLAALFCLVLPASWSTQIVNRCSDLSPGTRHLLRAIAVVGFGAAIVSMVLGRPARLFEDARLWLWLVTDALVLYLVFDHLWRDHRTTLQRPFARDAVPHWLWVVPVVVVLNGLTPYLEIKTAYSYTMYSNLVTADGRTNHILVPRTLPVNGRLADLVRIKETDDPGLAAYISLGYDLPYLSLRAYLSGHRSVAVTYLRAGVEHRLAHASDDPDLVRAVSELERRVFALRAVDQLDPPRCQDVFLPAL